MNNSTFDNSGMYTIRYTEILENLFESIEGKYGTSLSTDEKEFTGHLCRLIALVLSEMNERLQDVYDASSIYAAIGSRLSDLVGYLGLTRRKAAPTYCELTFTATKACTVKAGTRVKCSDTGVELFTGTDLVFSGAGSDTVIAYCVEVGDIVISAGEVDTVLDVVSGITSSSVTNLTDGVQGCYTETDDELRARHSERTKNLGDNTLSKFYQAISSVDGVSSVRITEDFELTPPMEIFVVGGEDIDVATIIDAQLQGGLTTRGSTEVNIVNETTQQNRTIRFTRPSSQAVYVTCIITANQALYPGDDQVSDAIIDVVSGFRAGDVLNYFEIAKAIQEVPGTSIDSLYIGLNANPTSTGNIQLPDDKDPLINNSTIIITRN